MSNQNQFRKVCKSGNISKLKDLLRDNTINIDLQDKYGKTALHNACENGHLPCAELFVEKGANIDLRNYSGWTALHYACINGKLECAKLLLDKGNNGIGFIPNIFHSARYFLVASQQAHLGRNCLWIGHRM